MPSIGVGRTNWTGCGAWHQDLSGIRSARRGRMSANRKTSIAGGSVSTGTKHFPGETCSDALALERDAMGRVPRAETLLSSIRGHDRPARHRRVPPVPARETFRAPDGAGESGATCPRWPIRFRCWYIDELPAKLGSRPQCRAARCLRRSWMRSRSCHGPNDHDVVPCRT